MTRCTRRLTVARRTLLVATTSAGLAFAAAPLAQADAPPPPAAAVVAASPGTGIPVFGGLIDSVVGIVTGTAYGIAGATGAVVCSVVPVCPTVPAS